MRTKRKLQGRFVFFRKLKLFDYLLVIMFVFAGIILFKFFNPEEKWINVVVLSQNTSFSQVNYLRKEDYEVDPSGKKIAEVLDIEAYDILNSSSNKDALLTTKILIKISPRTGEFQYKNRTIKIGSPIELKLNSVLIKGVISKLEGVEDDDIYEVKIITIVLYNQWSWLAESIKIGEGETSGDGKKILEIISKEVTAAKITTTTNTGDTLVKTDPQKVDVTLKVKVQVQRAKNQLIFRNSILNVGDTFSFIAGTTQVKNAFITNIE